MYPGGKNTRTSIFNYFPCSYLGEENVISDMLSHSKEQKPDVSLSVQIPLPPQLLFSCLQLHVLLLQSTHCWCAAAGIGVCLFSSLLWILLLFAQGEKPLGNLKVFS